MFFFFVSAKYRNFTPMKFKQVPQVTIKYTTELLPPSERPQITSPLDAYELMATIFDPETVTHHEQMFVLLMGQDARVFACHKLSQGSTTGTVADVRIILQAAILANAVRIILSHNHPSGNLKASEADIRITKQLNEACKYHGIILDDHVIYTPWGFTSMACEGLI